MAAVPAKGPLAGRVDPAPPRRPFRVFVGARCNNGCRSCPLEEADTDAAEVDAALARGRESGAESVTFVGGEPTVHDALPEWIARARALGYRSVGLQTNGRRLAYARYARHLAETGLTQADVSLHGPRAAIHEHHTRVPGSFRQTVAGLGAARSAGLAVGVTSVVTRSSYRHLTELVQLVSTLGVDALHLAIALPVGGAALRFDSVVPRLSLVAPHVRAAAEQARRSRIYLGVTGLPPCLSDAPVLPVAASEARAPAVYGPACDACALAAGCPGVPAAYADRFGLDELRPVHDVLLSREVAEPDPRRLRFSGI